MISYFCNIQKLNSQILEVAKLFLPFEDYFEGDFDNAQLKVIVSDEKGKLSFFSSFFEEKYTTILDIDVDFDHIIKERYIKRWAKLSLYRCMQQKFHMEMAWGALTGIRPTKFAYDLMANENSNYIQQFNDVFDVSKEKIKLVQDIILMQDGLRKYDDNLIDIYVGIPFCNTKCSYCSFASGEIRTLSKYVHPFVDKVKSEIIGSLEIIKKFGYKINCVYFGGGTPTSISAIQLGDILKLFNGLDINELTVEAGRPDTIDEEKLNVLKLNNVNRISINPQSFNQSTLDIIGRKHSVDDVVSKFNLARNYGFDINMDLIAGLANEREEDFYYSLQRCIELKPDNITVHTLAVKKGSQIAICGQIPNDNNVTNMVAKSRECLEISGYKPYYMYKQKYMTSNLENVGYCLSEKQCKYNINIMEETTNIMACGCNAVSKRLFTGNRLERYGNPKDVITYIDKIDNILQSKNQLFNK